MRVKIYLTLYSLTTFSIEKNYIFGKIIQFPTFLDFYWSQDSLCKCLKISMQVDGCLFFQFCIASNAPKETLNFLHTPSNMFLVKVLKNSIKLLARLRFSLTRSINGFRDLDRTHSLILTLYFHMHHVKFHLMKSSKRCLDTLYFESPFEFMSLNIFNSCRNEN